MLHSIRLTTGYAVRRLPIYLKGFKKMERYPQMDIHFPEAREADLHEEMKRLAVTPWSPQEHDAFGRPAEQGRFYFHREHVADKPSCTLCIYREEPGHWVVIAIVPDEGEIRQIPIVQYKNILSSFQSEIAGPASETVEGMPPMIEISQYRLEDYFSQRAIKLLENFCKSANLCDLGTHPYDQERWISFLLQAYDDGNNIHCDIFRYCLQMAKWWPDEGISDLVSEYDFAMRLLKQSGRKSKQMNE